MHFLFGAACESEKLAKRVSHDYLKDVYIRKGYTFMNKKNKTILAVVLLLGIFACILIGIENKKLSENGTLEPLKVTILKVGQADAIVVQSGECTMIIDTGEEEDGEELVKFLKNQGISYVDTMIITHFDKDHVGGADTLVESVEIGQIIAPDYEGNITEYYDFVHALENRGLSMLHLTKTLEFAFGDAVVKIEPPASYEVPESDKEVDNNFSLITTISHGDNNLLFMGDAQKQRIREWLSGDSVVDCDFLKVPHHGVYNKALKELFEAISPQYAVICSSSKNTAEAKTLEALKQYNVSVLETKDGDVTVISNGVDLEIHQDLDD